MLTEERDRPALLVVDQRMSMFFGSRRNMKSVTAAEIAALAAWRVLASGDRVGGVVFDDGDWTELRPQRSRRAVHRLLELVSRANLALRADSPASPRPGMLARAVHAAGRLVGHDALIVLISDFDGADDAVREDVARLARHNDVVLALVHDPMAREIPAGSTLVAGDGELQIRLDLGDRRLRERIEARSGERLQRLIDWQHETGAAVLPISAGEDTADQVHRLLGVPQRRSRRR